jgi:hypothetical protein
VALGGDEFFGGDVVAVVGAVSAGVAGAEDGGDGEGVGGGVAEEDAAALVRVGLLAVGAEVVVEGVGEVEGHGCLVLAYRDVGVSCQFSVVSSQLEV